MSGIFDLRTRVIVVTGAAGQLGRQFCATLIAQGARVVALDLPPPEAARPGFGALADHGDFMYIPCDVTVRRSVEDALARIDESWQTPYGLINNAGLDSPPDAPAAENGPFETYPEESWDKVMAVNTKGVMICCQVFGGAMASAGRGTIVNIGSIYGLVSPVQDIYDYRRRRGETFFKPVAYSASKSALINLTRYLATYWAKRGVRVNLLTLAGVYNNQDSEFLESYLARIPIGRMAEPGEYNGAIVFLMSDAAAYMTGANMVLDGGWTAW